MAASCCSVAGGVSRRWDETVREVAVRRVTDGALREGASQKRRNARIQSSRYAHLDLARIAWRATGEESHSPTSPPSCSSHMRRPAKTRRPNDR
jgi:hypothetical protein